MAKMKLLGENQMEAIRKVAEQAMTTPVTIMRRTGDTGLDLSDDPYGGSVSFSDVTPMGGVLGWLHSTPTPVQQLDSGAIVTFNTYRLFLPHDADCRPGDHVQINEDVYVVSDTTADETWPALLACTLRLRE